MPSDTSRGKSLWANGVVLSFDLDTESLKKYFSKTSPQGAYDVIKRFLKGSGFEHRRDSDYVNSKLDKIDTSKLLYLFAKDNKWFPLCVNKMIISPNIITLDIVDDIKGMIDEDWKAQKDKSNSSAL